MLFKNKGLASIAHCAALQVNAMRVASQYSLDGDVAE